MLWVRPSLCVSDRTRRHGAEVYFFGGYFSVYWLVRSIFRFLGFARNLRVGFLLVSFHEDRTQEGGPEPTGRGIIGLIDLPNIDVSLRTRYIRTWYIPLFSAKQRLGYSNSD